MAEQSSEALVVDRSGRPGLTYDQLRAVIDQAEARFPDGRLEFREDYPGGIDVVGPALDGQHWLAVIDTDAQLDVL